ncbi:tyrosine-type recombinase/integrase [Cellulomonas sp.]|uniref:tyrosine-type recombinase/integrase n=1 Tax=Cellulomonas sp. TaxID=40001 RepID=UPI001B03737F|nr:tyrosine-type recombinase/integrase [Cellulomonas sp.]MBO9553209.1 tyrosine-type recombinase/integrase [Cellulomonas sp.]
MTIRKTRGGRFRAQLKNGRLIVGSRTFDTKGEAAAWLKRERAALDGGVDPRAGKEPTARVLERWLAVRQHTVALKTYRADRDLIRLMPISMQRMHLSAVTTREVARSFESLLSSAPRRSPAARGRAPMSLEYTSVVRYRASLNAFFAWCVRERLIWVNPVTGVRVPRSSRERAEMNPFTEGDLEHHYGLWAEHDETLADVLLLLGWTALRWGEARALVVADFVELPTPGLLVRRSEPEGVGRKATKGRTSRRVPLANRVLPIVRNLAAGKAPGDLLLTTSHGAKLYRSSVLRTLHWTTTGGGRRLHDLRHTAACLWLSRGVDPGTVQAWCGHESIATTNRYLHFLGTGADQAGLNRLNEGWGCAGGARNGPEP